MTIRMLQAYNGYFQNQIVDLGGPEETRLIGLGLAVADVQPGGGVAIPLRNDIVLSRADDQKIYACMTALTVTVPAGISPRPSAVFIPPATGNLSIATSGGAQINGATTTLTRGRSSNPAGIVIQPYAESDGYGVSGS